MATQTATAPKPAATDLPADVFADLRGMVLQLNPAVTYTLGHVVAGAKAVLSPKGYKVAQHAGIVRKALAAMEAQGELTRQGKRWQLAEQAAAPAPKQAPKPAATLSPADREFVLFTAQVGTANLTELRKLAREAGIKSGGVKKADLQAALRDAKAAELGLDDAPEQTATDPAKAAPSKPQAATRKTLGSTTNAPARFCMCGCGEQVNKLFRQGHDARHAGNLVRKWEGGELTRSKAIAAAQRISDALGRKVVRGIEVREERAAKAKAAKKAK